MYYIIPTKNGIKHRHIAEKVKDYSELHKSGKLITNSSLSFLMHCVKLLTRLTSLQAIYMSMSINNTLCFSPLKTKKKKDYLYIINRNLTKSIHFLSIFLCHLWFLTVKWELKDVKSGLIFKSNKYILKNLYSIIFKMYNFIFSN